MKREYYLSEWDEVYDKISSFSGGVITGISLGYKSYFGKVLIIHYVNA